MNKLKGLADRAREIVGDRPVNVELRFRLLDGYPIRDDGTAVDELTYGWSIQARTDDGRRIISGYGDTEELVLAELKSSFERETRLPDQAEMVAAILRGINPGSRGLSEICEQAVYTVEQERRGRER
jgi:hypothetical protein